MEKLRELGNIQETLDELNRIIEAKLTERCNGSVLFQLTVFDKKGLRRTGNISDKFALYVAKRSIEMLERKAEFEII